jgi:hypothetical protein
MDPVSPSFILYWVILDANPISVQKRVISEAENLLSGDGSIPSNQKSLQQSKQTTNDNVGAKEDLAGIQKPVRFSQACSKLTMCR